MSPDELLERIINLYQDARISRYADSKISRGRSHSISSVVEDLFASYLILSDKEIDNVLVDQPVFVEGVKSTFYPDITIIRNGEITAFIDLKMDLGWKRDGLKELCEKREKEIYASHTQELNKAQLQRIQETLKKLEVVQNGTNVRRI